MINQKEGLLQRVRIVLTALVVLSGIGTTMMSMKPIDKMAAYTYGVSDYSATQWQIVRNLTSADPNTYECNNPEPDKVCAIRTNSPLSNNAIINKNSPSVTVASLGTFIPL